MSTQAETASRRADRKAAMPFIMLVVLIDMLSIGIIIPVLPAMVGSFTSSPAEQAYWYGVVTFTFGLANFLASPLLGALSDRYGRRPVLLLGFCGLAFSFFATAASTSLWMLILVRLVAGAMQSNASVANAYVADISAPQDRARRFGMLGAMFGVGFILGPVMGGLLGGIDQRLPFVVAGGLALLNLLYGCFVLPESLPTGRRRGFVWAAASPVKALRDLAELKGVGRLVGVLACSGLAQFVLYTVWVLYGSFKFGWGPVENGWSLAAVGLMSVIVQGGLLALLLRRFKPQALALAGLASSAVGFLLWGTATEGWMMYAVIFGNVLGYTVAASLQSIVSAAAQADEQGRILGAASSLNSLMAVLAPLVGAPLLGLVSHLPQGDWRIGAPFFFCAALQLAALMLAWTHFHGAHRGRVAAAAATRRVA